MGNQAITGYAHEPWRIRYVGHDLVRDMQEAALVDPEVDTMEEFFGLEPAPDYRP